MSGGRAATVERTHTNSGVSRAVRTDIQGLRAVAVALVVVYHVWPAALPGGFTGVDVFLVISGYLITLHLCEHPPRGPRDLAVFWGRRVRRLLPASLLVLVSTLVLTRMLGPETQWERTAREVVAATLYGVNWLLANDSVDYLGAEAAPSPVQHFWSLSVEEQFYLLWPVVLLVLAWLAAQRRWATPTVLVAGVFGVTLVSLAYSVLLTERNPAAAYFVTPTRVWELGAGGLLAVVLHARATRGVSASSLTPRARSILAWTGLTGIALAAFTFSSGTPFPGSAALLPVLATVLVIAARAPDVAAPGAPGPLLATGPVQWLGDVSYSVYLWHWPLVVLVPRDPDAGPTVAEAAVIVFGTLVLAHLTKQHVEDRFRGPGWGRPLSKPFALGAVGMAVVLALAALQLHEVRQREGSADERLAQAVAEGGPCFGAAALDAPAACPSVAVEDVVPPPAQAAEDRSDAYAEQADGRDCWANPPAFPVRRCEFGSADPDAPTVLLMGNSHAGQWLPALQVLADEQDLRVVTFLASQCAAVEAPQAFDRAGATSACGRWVEDVVSAAADEQPDAVVYTNRVSVPLVGESLEQSYVGHVPAVRGVLEQLASAGLPVLVLRDTPAPDDLVPDCLAASDDVAACDGTREEWLPPEPAQEAVADLADRRVRFADLVDHVCEGQTCRAVTGGVVTYFDGSHLTATYAATLAPYLWRELAPLLREAR